MLSGSGKVISNAEDQFREGRNWIRICLVELKREEKQNLSLEFRERRVHFIWNSLAMRQMAQEAKFIAETWHI